MKIGIKSWNPHGKNLLRIVHEIYISYDCSWILRRLVRELLKSFSNADTIPRWMLRIWYLVRNDSHCLKWMKLQSRFQSWRLCATEEIIQFGDNCFILHRRTGGYMRWKYLKWALETRMTHALFLVAIYNQTKFNLFLISSTLDGVR